MTYYDVLLRKTDSNCLIFFCLLFLFIRFVASILLLNFVLNRKLWATCIFDKNADRCVDKIKSKIFQFKFASILFIVNGKFLWPKILNLRQLVLQIKHLLFHLGDFMPFICIFLWLSKRKKGILTNSLLLYKSSYISTPNCNFNFQKVRPSWLTGL